VTTLKQYMAEIREINTEKGWRTGTNTFGDYIALAHSELSEALEAYRDHRLEDATLKMCMSRWQHATPNHICKPEGVGSEMADALIRILDMCDIYGIDIEAEMRRKQEYARTRPYQHGGRTLADDA
jgi:NTP pyrophosphatase (non-canonical NTP hydrolase)